MLIIVLFAAVSIGFTIYKDVNEKETTGTHSETSTKKQKSPIQNSGTKNPSAAIKSSGEKHQVGIQIGDTAPDFQLASLDNKKVSLSALRGKKVVLNFWATWCPPCQQEMPDIEQYYKNASHDKVIVLGVNLTIAEKNITNVKKFKDDFHLTFPILLEQKGEVSTQYQTRKIPTSYIIDSHGIIRSKMIGPMNRSG